MWSGMINRNMFYYQVSMLQGIRNDSYERTIDETYPARKTYY